MAELTAQAMPTPTRINKRYALALGGGMALEWYDFNVYGLMAALLAPHFFPGHDPVAATLSALAVFAVGFAVRPLAAIVLGPISDRLGHKGILLLSIGSISASSLIMGLLPTYEQIGLWAAGILLVARLIQGLSTGIEQAVGNAAAVELSPGGNVGRFTTIVSGSILQFGIMLASLVAFITSSIIGGEAMADWGWRVPFLVGGVAGVAVLWMRRSLPETGANTRPDQAPKSTADVWRTIWRYRLAFVAIVFVVAGTQVANYTWVTGLPSVARAAFHEDPTSIFAITTALGVLMVICGAFVGALCDRYGNSRVFTLVRLSLVPTLLLVLLYTEPGIWTFAVVMLVGGVSVALNQTLFNFIIATLMPEQSRTTGMAVAYGLAVAIFGGTASYLLLWAQQHDLLWLFVGYASALALISVVLYRWAVRKGQVFIGD
jgi:MHS family alpha-ketoglutarate permease-like MFS transporter